MNNNITTWFVPGYGFGGYWNRYLESQRAEYKAHKVADLRAFMLAGVKETGYDLLVTAIKKSKKDGLVRIIASFPQAFGIICPAEFRTTTNS
jgi:hypothetical protein